MKELTVKSIRAIRYLYYRHLNINEQLEINKYLTKSNELSIFWNMGKADRHHSYEVLKRTQKVTDDMNLLILSLFHDIGKSEIHASWLFRILSELNIINNEKSNKYLNHEKLGYEILIKKNFSDELIKNYNDNLLMQKNKYLDKTDY